MEVKLCKDCRHCQPYTDGKEENRLQLATCGSEQAAVINLVDGSTSQKFCESMRLGSCGVDAKLWEAK